MKLGLDRSATVGLHLLQPVISSTAVLSGAARNLALSFPRPLDDPAAGRHHTTREVKTYFVYIGTSKSRTLYIGVTSNLKRRVLQHRDKRFEGFTARYNINRLVYFQRFGDVRTAIGRRRKSRLGDG